MKAVMYLIENDTNLESLCNDETEQIEQAVLWINQQVEETAMIGMIRIGEYILETFFHNDPEEAQSYNPGKNHSFSRLAKHPALVINRSTLQNAVGVAILRRTYAISGLSLKMSHLAALLPLRQNHMEALIDLARRADEEQWSVRKIKEEVRALRIIASQRHERNRIEKDMTLLGNVISRMTRNFPGIEMDLDALKEIQFQVEDCIDAMEELADIIHRTISDDFLPEEEQQ